MLEHVYVVLVKLKRSVRERDFVEPVERIDAERQQREDTPAIEGATRLRETRPLPPVGEPRCHAIHPGLAKHRNLRAAQARASL